MQYVAFKSAMDRHVPVLLTDGNIMILYVHILKLNKHHRVYWSFDQIEDASMYLQALVKQIALNNPLILESIPGQDDQPDPPGDPGTRHRGLDTDSAEPSMHHDECEHDDRDTQAADVAGNHGMSWNAGHTSLGQQHCLTDMQDAEMQQAMRLARFHPCVTAVYGLPRFAKPKSYGLTI